MEQPIYADFAQKKDRHYEWRKQPNADTQPQKTKADAQPQKTKVAKKVVLSDSYRKAHELYRFFAKDSVILRQLRHALEAVEIYPGCKTIRPKVNALIEYLFCDQTGSLDDTKNAQSIGHLHASTFLSEKQVAQICEQLGANELVEYRIWEKRTYHYSIQLLIVETNLFPPYTSTTAPAAEGLAPQPEFRLFIAYDIQTLDPITFFVVPGAGADYDAWEQHIDAIHRRDLHHTCIWVTGNLGLSNVVASELNALGMVFIVPKHCKLDPKLAPYTERGVKMAFKSNGKFAAQELAFLAQELQHIAALNQPFRTELGWLKDRTWAECQNRFKGQMILIFCAMCLSDEAYLVFTMIHNELKRYISQHPSNSAQAQAYHELQVWLDQLKAGQSSPGLAQLFNWFRAKPPINEATPLNAATSVSTERWSQTAQERDRLFYAMLGLEPFPEGFTNLPNFPWLKQPY